MKNCVTDEALLFKQIGQELINMVATYVDDVLNEINEQYGDINKATEKKFQCEKREYDNFQNVGVENETNNDEFAVQ